MPGADGLPPSSLAGPSATPWSVIDRADAPARGGWGAAPPTSLDTQGDLLPNGEGVPASGPVKGPRSKVPHRHRLGRPVRDGWRGWIARVSDALTALGAVEMASNLRGCGQMAMVTPCRAVADGGCGDPYGRVEVRISCDMRCCPWCSRRAAQERVELVTAAAMRVADMQAAQLAAVRAKLEGQEHQAQQAVAHWSMLALAAANRAERRQSERERERDEAKARRHRERAERAGQRVGLARRQLRGVAELHRWGWKLVTLSPRWDPTDAAAYEPAAMRERADDVLARWSRCWEAGARAGGLAAATVRTEMSAGGHIHVHVLYRGPWVPQEWWQETAGCIVDVRAIRATSARGAEREAKRAEESAAAYAERVLRGAVTEAVKYALKTPTPTSPEWMAGDRREVVHPELAARWMIATRHMQLIRHYGVMADAIAAEIELAEPPEERPADSRCASCGSELHTEASSLHPTAKVARALGPLWKAPPGVSRWGVPLPKRVQITRSL